jgi:hypothetical protein
MQANKKQREKFRFYTHWYDQIAYFSTEEIGILFKAIVDYVFNQKYKDLPPHLIPVFESLKHQIDESFEREKVNLYVVKLYNSKESFFKIGVASNVKKRICSFTSIGYKIALLDNLKAKFDDRKDAMVFEKKLHNKLKLFRYFPEKEFGGQFECFSGDCLDSIAVAINELKQEI